MTTLYIDRQGSQESSFLVFGLALEEAKALCVKLEQNGFVWSGGDAIPRLILLK